MRAAGLLVVLLGASAGLASSPAGSSQAQKPDLSVAESKKISPFPPKNVEAKVTDGVVVVKWTKVPSERITGYDIYRATDNGKLEKVGYTEDLEFVDKAPPKGKLAYAVASVDYNDNRSKVRTAEVKKDN
jgi:hypothetical protein